MKIPALNLCSLFRAFLRDAIAVREHTLRESGLRVKYVRIFLSFFAVRWFWLITPVPGNLHVRVFELEARTKQTDKRTDRRTGKTRNAAYLDDSIITVTLANSNALLQILAGNATSKSKVPYLITAATLPCKMKWKRTLRLHSLGGSIFVPRAADRICWMRMVIILTECV